MYNSTAVEVGKWFLRAEAVGLQRRLRDCFRTLEGEQGPVTHIQSSLCVCVYEWASACVFPCSCVYVCAWAPCVYVCAYICRENVSTIVAFGFLDTTDINVFVGIREDFALCGCLGSAVSRCLWTNGEVWLTREDFLVPQRKRSNTDSLPVTRHSRKEIRFPPVF